MEGRIQRSGGGSPIPVSISVPLQDHKEISAAVTNLRGTLVNQPDSIRVSIRGPRSVVVSALSNLKDSDIHVSAAVSLRGDKPAGG